MTLTRRSELVRSLLKVCPQVCTLRVPVTKFHITEDEYFEEFTSRRSNNQRSIIRCDINCENVSDGVKKPRSEKSGPEEGRGGGGEEKRTNQWRFHLREVVGCIVCWPPSQCLAWRGQLYTLLTYLVDADTLRGTSITLPTKYSEFWSTFKNVFSKRQSLNWICPDGCMITMTNNSLSSYLNNKLQHPQHLV